MHKEKNGAQSLFVSIVIIVLFIGSLVAFGMYTKPVAKDVTSIPKEETNEKMTQKITNCGLTVVQPLESEILGSKFEIETILDNTKRDELGCSWTSFEAQAGVVYVKDLNGKDIADPIPLATSQDWMTPNAVEYKAQINIKNSYTGQAIIVINEEDPSGEKISKNISFPVFIGQ
jgi:hypothetical protein